MSVAATTHCRCLRWWSLLKLTTHRFSHLPRMMGTISDAHSTHHADGSMSDDRTGDALAERNRYKEFATLQYSSHTLMVAATAFTVFNAVVFTDSNFLAEYTKMSAVQMLFELVTKLLRLCVVCMLWCVWAHKTEGSIFRYGAKPSIVNCTWTSTLQAVCPVLTAVALSVQVIFNAGYRPLDAHQLYVIICVMKVYPLITSFILRDTRPEALMIAWVVCVITALVHAAQMQSGDLLTHTCAYVFTSSIILYDTYRQNMNVFKLVTKLKDTLRENEALAVEAQALELRAMIGNVAHDLKTPLTSFLGGIEFMREVVASWECTLDSPNFCTKAADNFTALKNCLRTMEGTNSFMTMSINRCLDFTKASKGFKLVPKFETVSLHQKAAFSVQLVRDLQSSSARIHVNPWSSDICTHIITDRQWLVENLLCLLSNAVKYSDKGTVDVSVLLEQAEEGGEPHLRFEVQDTGIGLSDEAMASLFCPFKQAQRLAGGTGLGLYSLAMRVDALHGQYGVSKRPDGAQGSLFWFTIPYRPDVMSAKLALNAVSPLQSPRRADGHAACVESSDSSETPVHLHVLVVDDAPMIVKMTSMLLKRKGHSVQNAVNGAEALEKIQQGCDDHQRPFDMVLMDLQMPVLDGIEAIRRLRAAEKPAPSPRNAASNLLALDLHKLQGGRPKQFVIALSANSDVGTMQEALDAGADAFMPKPFTYENFVAAMHH